MVSGYTDVLIGLRISWDYLHEPGQGWVSIGCGRYLASVRAGSRRWGAIHYPQIHPSPISQTTSGEMDAGYVVDL